MYGILKVMFNKMEDVMKLAKSKALTLSAVLCASLFMGACSQKQEQPKEEQKQEQKQEETKAAEVKQMKGADLEALQNDKKKKDEVLVVDVRDAEEYKAGHIIHAINVPLAKIKEDASVLDAYKQKPIILYCNSGKKSGEAADILVKAGYPDITNAEGVKTYKYSNLVTYTDITGKELEERANDGKTLIVDVRPEADYKEGHVKGAINVPFDKVEENLDKLPKDKDIALYCFTGNKSSGVAKELTDKGYEQIFNSIEGTKEYNFALEK